MGLFVPPLDMWWVRLPSILYHTIYYIRPYYIIPYYIIPYYIIPYYIIPYHSAIPILSLALSLPYLVLRLSTPPPPEVILCIVVSFHSVLTTIILTFIHQHRAKSLPDLIYNVSLPDLSISEWWLQ